MIEETYLTKFFICLTVEGSSLENVKVEIADPFKPLRDLIMELVRLFELPKMDNGGFPIQYVLVQVIDDDAEPNVLEFEDEDGREQCLIDYNIQSGDHLHLISVPIAGGCYEKEESFPMPEAEVSEIFDDIDTVKGKGFVDGHNAMFHDLDNDGVFDDATLDPNDNHTFIDDFEEEITSDIESKPINDSGVVVYQPAKRSFFRRLLSFYSDSVFSSVFAPHEINRGDEMMIQVYVYKEGERATVCSEAIKSDGKTRERAYTPLNFQLKKGNKVDVMLHVPGMKLEKTSKSFIWQGYYTKASFFVTIPNDWKGNRICGEVFLSVNNAILGELDFVTEVNEDSTIKQGNAEVFSRQYNKIFISYAHQDEHKVKYLAEAYKAQGINYFFDRHYLKGGDIFPYKIQEYINSADLFILCWSENALKSEYVKKECSQALELAFPNVQPIEKATLSIYPLSIEPRADLPKEMKDTYNFEIL